VVFVVAPVDGVFGTAAFSMCYDFGCRHGIRSASPQVVNMDCSVTKRATILLVDDDVEVLKALTKVLEKDHYEVVAHPNAMSAIDFVNSSKKMFDLVVTDVSMPGMKGTTFLTAVKTAFPAVPVIVITAFGDWGQYMETLREGAYEYLSKPLEKTELLSAVRHALTNGAKVDSHKPATQNGQVSS
jgi:DNA-binding NtrC family response regulator